LSLRTIRFPARVGFHETLKARIDQYFAEAGKAKTGDWRLFLKTGIILTWLALAYLLFIFFASSLLVWIGTIFALASGFALLSFNTLHDGGHKSYSRHKAVNWCMGFMLDLMGGSSVLWRQKHNILHHTYTNIHDLDSDLDTAGLLRLSPHQPWRPWHRFQHIYGFPIYSFLTLSWVTFSDFRKFFSGHIGPYKLRPPTTLEASLFFLAKIFYVGYMLVLPLFFQPVLHVLAAFVAVHLVLGFTLSLVFQLAHTVEHNAFPVPQDDSGMMAQEWAVHEVETTANFAPTNVLARWCFGGLNFQIEHHLFPYISHVHYPAISAIVKKTCDEFALTYVSYPTVRAAIAIHYRFLKTLGHRPC
jgi:linoleoyl-CoA desaturase